MGDVATDFSLCHYKVRNSGQKKRRHGNASEKPEETRDGNMTSVVKDLNSQQRRIYDHGLQDNCTTNRAALYALGDTRAFIQFSLARLVSRSSAYREISALSDASSYRSFCYTMLRLYYSKFYSNKLPASFNSNLEKEAFTEVDSNTRYVCACGCAERYDLACKQMREKQAACERFFENEVSAEWCKTPLDVVSKYRSDYESQLGKSVEKICTRRETYRWMCVDTELVPDYFLIQLLVGNNQFGEYCRLLSFARRYYGRSSHFVALVIRNCDAVSHVNLTSTIEFIKRHMTNLLTDSELALVDVYCGNSVYLVAKNAATLVKLRILLMRQLNTVEKTIFDTPIIMRNTFTTSMCDVFTLSSEPNFMRIDPRNGESCADAVRRLGLAVERSGMSDQDYTSVGDCAKKTQPNGDNKSDDIDTELTLEVSPLSSSTTTNNSGTTSIELDSAAHHSDKPAMSILTFDDIKCMHTYDDRSRPILVKHISMYATMVQLACYIAGGNSMSRVMTPREPKFVYYFLLPSLLSYWPDHAYIAKGIDEFNRVPANVNTHYSMSLSSSTSSGTEIATVEPACVSGDGNLMVNVGLVEWLRAFILVKRTSTTEKCAKPKRKYRSSNPIASNSSGFCKLIYKSAIIMLYGVLNNPDKLRAMPDRKRANELATELKSEFGVLRERINETFERNCSFGNTEYFVVVNNSAGEDMIYEIFRFCARNNYYQLLTHEQTRSILCGITLKQQNNLIMSGVRRRGIGHISRILDRLTTYVDTCTVKPLSPNMEVGKIVNYAVGDNALFELFSRSQPPPPPPTTTSTQPITSNTTTTTTVASTDLPHTDASDDTKSDAINITDEDSTKSTINKCAILKNLRLFCTTVRRNYHFVPDPNCADPSSLLSSLNILMEKLEYSTLNGYNDDNRILDSKNGNPRKRARANDESSDGNEKQPEKRAHVAERPIESISRSQKINEPRKRTRDISAYLRYDIGQLIGSEEHRMLPIYVMRDTNETIFFDDCFFMMRCTNIRTDIDPIDERTVSGDSIIYAFVADVYGIDQISPVDENDGINNDDNNE